MIPQSCTLTVMICAILLTACRTSVPDPSAGHASPPTTRPTSSRPQPAEVTSISFESLFQLHQRNRALIFDSRLPIIHRLGHISGSINLPLNRAEERIRELEPKLKSALLEGMTIVTYCSGPDCPDSHKLAKHFAARGYPTSVFIGGWQEWSALQETLTQNTP